VETIGKETTVKKDARKRTPLIIDIKRRSFHEETVFSKAKNLPEKQPTVLSCFSNDENSWENKKRMVLWLNPVGW